MKILPRAFLLSVVASFLVSCASYYLFVFLCNRFAPFLLPFVFITTVLISVILFYLSAVYYRNFFAELRNDKLIIYKGFIIKRKIVLNLRFVVSAKNVSTPLMRLLKISNLLLLSEGSLCILPLIQAEDSERLYKTILTICEENEIAKDFYLSSYTNPMCLEIIRKSDTHRAKEVFGEYCTGWNEEDFAEAETLVSGIEYATLMTTPASASLEVRIAGALNQIMTLYNVPEDGRKMKIDKVLAMDYERIGRRIFTEFTEYIDSENHRLPEE